MHTKIRGRRTQSGMGLIVLLSVFWVGCGGMDSDDIRKYAIKRPKDDDGGPIPDLTKKTVTNAPANPAVNPVAPPPAVTNQPKQPVTSQAQPTNTSNVALVANNPANPANLPPAANANATSQTSAPNAAPTGISDTISPGAPLDQVERRRRTISNLQRIEKAIHAYFEQNRRYPAAASYSPSGQPMLSWRVTLLPYLGYQQLYDRIQKGEPWNGINNQKLHSMIPAVYQSPERYDDYTNYLVPYGSSTAFYGKKGKTPRRWDDGRENVAILLEVDDTHAVPWMQPADLEIDIRNPKNGLGGLREDGFFVVFGSGQLARIAATSSPADIKAMFTVDAGEPFSAGVISLAATPELPRARRRPTRSKVPNPQANDQTPVTAGNSGRVTSRQAPITASPDAAFMEKLLLAYQLGEAEVAQKMSFVGFITDRLDSIGSYKWIPALNRPAPFIRIGISLDYSGPKGNRLSDFSRDNLSSNGWHSQRGKIVSMAGDLAEEVLQVVERATPVVPVEISTSIEAEVERSRNRNSPDNSGVISLLGATDRKKMLRFADQNGSDILIHFDVEDRKTRAGKTNPRASVYIFDVQRRKVLYRSPVVSYRQRDKQISDPLYKDPVTECGKRVERVFAERLAAVSIPDELRSKHAVARVGMLTRSRDNVLSSLAEIDLYAKLELLTLDQKFDAYEAILDRKQALALVASDPLDRDKILEDFVPRFDPDVRRRRAMDDDDD